MKHRPRVCEMRANRDYAVNREEATTPRRLTQASQNIFYLNHPALVRAFMIIASQS
jgi:hypothetical protein